MIKIDKLSAISPKSRASKKRDVTTDATDNGFSELLDALGPQTATNEAATLQSVFASTPVNSMDVLLSAQAVPEETLQRQKQIKQAHLTLDSLEQLRRSLLMGAVPYYLLHDIEQHMNNLKQQVPDPELHDIMEEIELRAAVELAKLRIYR